MALQKISPRIETLSFSYREMAQMGFGNEFTRDYLDQIRNIEMIGESNDEVIVQVNTNTDDIETNKADIATNSANIATNTGNIATNATNIATNSASIATNTGNISTNTTNIATNATNIATNAAAIGGATGDLVGNEDYAQTAIGGVVLLAELIAHLTEITTADIGAAPAAYDQVYTQSVTDLTNENKAKINEIVDKINKIINGQVAAKQMSAV